MFTRIFDYFSQGFLFAKNNPQIIYTIFLIIVIPLAFLASGQKFLSVAKQNQERLEKERVGVMQDIFVELASSKMNDPAFLQESIERIKAQNEQSITEFKVLALSNGERTVIASLDKAEVGTADEDNNFIYNEVGIKGDSSKLFTVPVNGERHWNVVRGIVDRETGNLSGILLISVSMAAIDKIATQNIQSAYYFLFFIGDIAGVRIFE